MHRKAALAEQSSRKHAYATSRESKAEQEGSSHDHQQQHQHNSFLQGTAYIDVPFCDEWLALMTKQHEINCIDMSTASSRGDPGA